MKNLPSFSIGLQNRLRSQLLFLLKVCRGPNYPFTLRKSIWQVDLRGPVFEREGSAVWGELDLGSMPVLTWYTCPGQSASRVRWRHTRVTRCRRHGAPMRKHFGNTLSSGISEWAADKMLELWNIYTCHACVSSKMSSTVYWLRPILSLESFSTHGTKGHRMSTAKQNGLW